jgi:hypothetical protein
VSADIAHDLQSTKRTAVRSVRARLVLALGPATVLAGVGWAVVQPWRLTLLHPHGQGFWWLFSQPPLYVVLVGVAFRLLIAPALVEDMLGAEREGER